MNDSPHGNALKATLTANHGKERIAIARTLVRSSSNPDFIVAISHTENAATHELVFIQKTTVAGVHGTCWPARNAKTMHTNHIASAMNDPKNTLLIKRRGFTHNSTAPFA